MECIYCNSLEIKKNGNKNNKQRYFCNKCKRSFSLTDDRIKRDVKQKELALLLYSSNNSIRSIQSTINKFFDTNISFNVVDNWIKTNAKQVRKDIENNNKIKDKPKTIEIIELDELYSYFYDLKKNEKNRLKYGLLLTEDTTKLLHIK